MISSCAERESRRIAALPDAREVWCSVWTSELVSTRGHNVSEADKADYRDGALLDRGLGDFGDVFEALSLPSFQMDKCGKLTPCYGRDARAH